MLPGLARNIDAIYSSDLSRAMNTAKPVAEEDQIKVPGNASISVVNYDVESESAEVLFMGYEGHLSPHFLQGKTAISSNIYQKSVHYQISIKYPLPP